MDSSRGGWLKQAWYVAAWSSELSDALLGRTLLGEPVVLYRQADGRAVAIGGRCPHRFAPLALGRRVGDCVECPYHGLRFGSDGSCSHNPHGNGRIPALARVPAYPVEERDGLVWFWPGDAKRADPALVPSLAHLSRADLGHVSGYMGVNAHYELYVDNLMDLTHAQFVHSDWTMSNAFATTEQRVEQEGDTITNRIFIPSSDVPPMFKRHVPDAREVDYWLDSTWRPASVVTNWVGVTLPGRPREEGYFSYGTHIVTPATHNTSHYFYANSRNRKVDDPEVDAAVREWQRVGFGEQDKHIVEAAAAMMEGETDPLALRAVLLPTDAAAVRVRRTVARLFREEAEEAAAVS